MRRLVGSTLDDSPKLASWVWEKRDDWTQPQASIGTEVQYLRISRSSFCYQLRPVSFWPIILFFKKYFVITVCCRELYFWWWMSVILSNVLWKIQYLRFILGSLPHRQLRKIGLVPAITLYCSLPHRQLRKSSTRWLWSPVGSLPHRQLRNLTVWSNGCVKSSLPHRQLRNCINTRFDYFFWFTAAQAA